MVAWKGCRLVPSSLLLLRSFLPPPPPLLLSPPLPPPPSRYPFPSLRPRLLFPLPAPPSHPPIPSLRHPLTLPVSLPSPEASTGSGSPASVTAGLLQWPPTAPGRGSAAALCSAESTAESNGGVGEVKERARWKESKLGKGASWKGSKLKKREEVGKGASLREHESRSLGMPPALSSSQVLIQEMPPKQQKGPTATRLNPGGD